VLSELRDWKIKEELQFYINRATILGGFQCHFFFTIRFTPGVLIGRRDKKRFNDPVFKIDMDWRMLVLSTTAGRL